MPVTPGVDLSAREARRAQLAAQGLLGSRPSGPAAVISMTRGVQLDTISVLARSHELVAFARLGPLERGRIEAAYWGGPPYSTFEYWYHAACIVPIEEWPTLGFKRAERRARGFRWHRLAEPERSLGHVLSELHERGPLTARELGGAKRGGPWWDWSETKIAAEWLLDVGELVCTTRRGFQRVYDLPERAVPATLLAAELSREEAVRRLVERAADALGVATAGDLASYAGLKRAEVVATLAEGGFAWAGVEGWREPAVLGREAVDRPAVTGTARAAPRLLSPFDSLICDRNRVERLFGFRHRLEAYVPRARRVHGYYSMPILSGDRLVGRVDPGRRGKTLVAKRVHLEPGVRLAPGGRAVAAALWAAARWVGAESVATELVDPPELAPVLADALSHLSRN